MTSTSRHFPADSINIGHCRRCARIYLREARLRAGIPAQRGFVFTLLEWAGNARRRAMQAARTQIQGSLF